MKKGFKKTLLIFNILFVLTFAFVLSTSEVLAGRTSYESMYAKYEQVETVVENDLGYGIEHAKYIAKSTAKEGYYKNLKAADVVNAPQVVNVLTVPSTDNIRIINYSYQASVGWNNTTLTNTVKDFELKNPGWTVIAGVNGDFFDNKAGDKALPYTSNGATVTNGETIKASTSKGVGYKNDGSANSFGILSKVTYDSYYTLAIFDANNDVIATYKIDKVNSAPGENQTAVYYTYRSNVDANGDGKADSYEEHPITTPSENSYIVSSCERISPTSYSLFAKGEIARTNVEEELVFGRFAIVTNNEEIKAKLSEGVKIRVQKDLAGESAEYDNIIGVGSTLIENNLINAAMSDGMERDRHPRTTIGVKKDGTLMFFTVDGRQESQGMYGMTEFEAATMMALYGCYTGVNIDGGGSTTVGIRNENGNFVIMNTPSDGGERRNGNSLLIVVPEVKMQLSKYTDTTVNLYYGCLDSKISISDLVVTVNGISKPMTDTTMVFDGLTPNTDCILTYTYNLTYKGKTSTVTSKNMKFKTGKPQPGINKLVFDVSQDGNQIEFNYNITDSDSLISFLMIKYNGGQTSLGTNPLGSSSVLVSKLETLDFKLNMTYNTASTPVYVNEVNIDVNWFPAGINLNDYLATDQEIIMQKTARITESIKTMSITDAKTAIEAARAEIKAIEVKSVKLDAARVAAQTELQELINSKKFSKDNKATVNTIYSKAINDINTKETLEEIDAIIDAAISEINAVKTKGCSSSTALIPLYSLFTLSMGLYLIFKKR